MTPVNDQPWLETLDTPKLQPVVPGATDPPGDTVAAILGPSVFDPDEGALQGMAVVAAPAGVKGTWGTWQYRLPGSTS